MSTNFLDSALRQFEYYKSLGEKAMAQVPEEGLFWQYNEESNSIATIVKHLWGNMRSRWTDFLTTDGEKEWRDRESEFDNDITTRTELMTKWNEGWEIVFQALRPLQDSDLQTIIYIRNEGHTVLEAIHRQLAHYPYHVGQIVFLAKMLAAEPWKSLSIPKGGSAAYNTQKFELPKERGHFTEEFLEKKE